MYDIIIKNGTVIDGTGKPMFFGDLGIKDGKIKNIGEMQNEKAETFVDAEGLYVAPGFVDVNNHSDTYWRIFLNPDLESLLFQGVTTIIGGNCGSSLAPLTDKETIRSIQKWADIRNINLNWLSTEEFLREIEKNGLALNFGTLVGHGTIRRGLIRDEVRSLSEYELKVSRKMLRDALRQGALGFSTGLVYTHTKMAGEDEIMQLAEVVKEYNGVYATHVRGESGELLRSVEEAIRIARKTGVRMEISHLKAIGSKNWHLMDEAISMIETARMDEDMDVNFDVYPYTATGSVLYILLPDWVAEGGKRIMVQRLKDPEIRRKVLAEMRNDDFDYSKIIVSISPLNKTLSRKKISEIAEAQGKTVEEAVVDILVASDGRVVTIMDVLSEKNVIKGIRNPFSIVSSNGAGYNLEHSQSGDLVHPRNFGSFPRLLGKYVREKKILGWEEAIHKISGLPAEKFGLTGRGILKEGNFADVVIFNPEEINDLATIENPYQYSRGISVVMVNGKIVLANGKYYGTRAGQVLRRKSSGWIFG